MTVITGAEVTWWKCQFCGEPVNSRTCVPTTGHLCKSKKAKKKKVVNHKKYVCEDCRWHGKQKDLIVAPNPFMPEDILLACPSCYGMEVVWACDYPYCFAPVTSGLPTKNGYKSVCSKHYHMYEKNEVKK
jgi:hypothetical protein